MQTLKLTGIVADQPNVNGFIYPHNILNKAINNVRHVIKQRAFLGTIGSDEPTINNATHLVTELKLENNRVVNTIEILQTKTGQRLSNMLSEMFIPQSNLCSVAEIEGNVVKDMSIIAVNIMFKASEKETK